MPSRHTGFTPSTDDPQIGTVLAGKYRIRDVIARGGMGRIYRAEQMPLGRTVAIKVLSVRFETDEDPGFEDRFFLEAATLARLKHPNTVTVFDYGIDGDETFYMVMEFVEGRTLSHLLQTQGPMQPTRALRIAYEIARSLTEAHALGIVHRDLKPSNVMVVPTDEGETVKVVDFGIVKVLEDSPIMDTITRPDRMVGSPRYMAPEQIRKGDIDGRTDIYSLGVLLYEMLTGHPPFKGDNSIKTLMAHIQEPVPPMADKTDRSIPLPAEQLVRRCLQKKPENRFPDVTVFKQGVRSVLNDMGVGSAMDTLDLSGEHHPPGAQDSTTLATVPLVEDPRGRRRWIGPALAIGLIVMLAAGAAGGWALWHAWPPGPATASSTPTSPPPQGTAAVTPPVAPAPAPTTASGYDTASAWISSEPEGADIWEGEHHLGTTPSGVRLGLAPGDPPRHFEVKKPGYQPRTFVQGPSEHDVDLSVILEPLPAPHPHPRPAAPQPTPKPDLDIRTQR